jgi:hypothetical protein
MGNQLRVEVLLTAAAVAVIATFASEASKDAWRWIKAKLKQKR